MPASVLDRRIDSDQITHRYESDLMTFVRSFVSSTLSNISIMHIPPSGTLEYVRHAWVAHTNNQCVGHVHLFLEPGNKILFCDDWVHQNYRRRGIYRTLWETRWAYVTKHYQGYTAYGCCASDSLPLFVEKGFEKSITYVDVEKKIAE